MSTSYAECTLCGRGCGVDRRVSLGFCSVPDRLYVSRAALHHWEEPPISGTRGSGTIFFSGCSLGCVFCQNREISRGRSGREISVLRLAEIMLELEASGAHNINFVTPTHYAPSIKEAILTARGMGLAIPTVYNTGSYDTVETLRMLEGVIDIYLPDFKYYLPKTAEKLSQASDYPTVASAAISEMARQTGAPALDGEGIMRRGTIVRVLLLPGHVAEAKLAVKHLLDTYVDSVYVSLMSQYTPMQGMTPPLDRPVTHDEYRDLCDYAERVGVTLGFTQEHGTASESFIPAFDGEGVLPKGISP